MVTFAYRPPYNSNKDGFFKELNKSLSNIIYKKKWKCPCCWRSQYRYFRDKKRFEKLLI